MRIKKEYSLSLLFLLVSAVLLILMYFQYSYGQNYRSQIRENLKNNESAGFTMQQIPDYKASNKKSSDYAGIVERPLFFKVRRPIIPSIATEEEPVISSVSQNYKFVLTGIIRTPDDEYCLLQNTRSAKDEQKFFRMKEGDEIDGKVVEEIKSDRIVMVTGGISEELLLIKPRPKKFIPPKKRIKPAIIKSRQKNKAKLDKMVEKKRARRNDPPEEKLNIGSRRNPFKLDDR